MYLPTGLFAHMTPSFCEPHTDADFKLASTKSAPRTVHKAHFVSPSSWIQGGSRWQLFASWPAAGFLTDALTAYTCWGAGGGGRLQSTRVQAREHSS